MSGGTGKDVTMNRMNLNEETDHVILEQKKKFYGFGVIDMQEIRFSG